MTITVGTPVNNFHSARVNNVDMSQACEETVCGTRASPRWVSVAWVQWPVSGWHCNNFAVKYGHVDFRHERLVTGNGLGNQ